MNKSLYNLHDNLFLFDIDGTILNSTGAGKRAFLKAFELLFKTKIVEDVNFLGGIDVVIFKNIYSAFNLPENQFMDKWGDFQKLYLKLLNEASKNDDWKIFPGAAEAVNFLNVNSNIALVTGNIKKGAFIKLKKFNLDVHFKCGGYGDNHTKRKDIVKEAIENSRVFRKKEFRNDKIYLFGDTKSDIDSALENFIHPVLIDPESKHKETALNWNVKYHGNFKNIDRFFNEISNNLKSKYLCFC